jgi:acetylornithine/succinyldiaminopimelate/putrescine aminotransferase
VPKDPQALSDAVSDNTAAVLLEPIQGETGVNILSDELLQAARAACDRSGAALIFDEIQCGLGRTGTVWAYQQTGVIPDALTTAKALGGGLPIGALVTGPQLAEVLTAGDHGSTFPGGPLVCAAALAAMDILEDHALLAQVKELGQSLIEQLSALPEVRSVRGRGLMVAFELDSDAAEVTRRALLEQKLIINATDARTIRLLPPLIIDEDDISEAVARIAAVISQ